MTLATLHGFTQRVTARRRPPLDHEIVVDSFAGAGGWGVGEEAATGWAVDVAINHDAHAIAQHKLNHPATLHYESDVFEVDPRSVEPSRKIGHCHFSPDCTHHSKARGGAPVSDRVRGLAWIVLAWAAHRRPRVLTLENVEEFKDWGPTRGGKAIAGRKGETFGAFAAMLGGGGVDPEGDAAAEARRTLHGLVSADAFDRLCRRGLRYDFEHRELRACDYGSPTIRKRLFGVGRCDRGRIAWPSPTHGENLLPYHSADECIDWSLPCPSIFLTREQAKAWAKANGCHPPKRPLADKTLARIAAGVVRYVLDNPQPFIVRFNGAKPAGDHRVQSIAEPFSTLDTSNRLAVTTPYFVSVNHGDSGGEAVVAPVLIPRYGEREGQAPRSRSIEQPMPTITSGAGAKRPAGAAHATGITAARLVKLRGTCRDGQELGEPMPTLTGGGNHAGLVAAFLVKYFGRGVGQFIDEPAHTIKERDHLGLVTVQIAGEPYVLADIGMRMLQPHELLKAQFGEFADGWVLTGTKSQQVAGIGNSVCPHVARAIVSANVKLRRVEAAESEAA